MVEINIGASSVLLYINQPRIGVASTLICSLLTAAYTHSNYTWRILNRLHFKTKTWVQIVLIIFKLEIQTDVVISVSNRNSPNTLRSGLLSLGKTTDLLVGISYGNRCTPLVQVRACGYEDKFIHISVFYRAIMLQLWCQEM